MKTAEFKTRILNGQLVIQKVWITFFNNGFEKNWLPLTDLNDNQLFWEVNASRKLREIASKKFPNTSFGLAWCEQKEMNNAVTDNL